MSKGTPQEICAGRTGYGWPDFDLLGFVMATSSSALSIVRSQAVAANYTMLCAPIGMMQSEPSEPN